MIRLLSYAIIVAVIAFAMLCCLFNCILQFVYYISRKDRIYLHKMIASLILFVITLITLKLLIYIYMIIY